MLVEECQVRAGMEGTGRHPKRVKCLETEKESE
jgi:hypothetical protein